MRPTIKKILSGSTLLLVVVFGYARADWKTEWDKTLRAANEEGRVVVYTYPGQELVFQEFQKKYPEIKLVEVSVRGADRTVRIAAERRAGKYLADLLIGGAGSAYFGLYKTGALDPIKPAMILPEVVDESKWWARKHIYGDDEGKYILAFAGAHLYYFYYNTNLLSADEFKSYWDLLHPKWRGKILIAEPLSGGTPEILQFLYHNPELGPEFLRRFFTEMDLTVTRDIRQLLDWLAQGKYAIAGFQNADRVGLWEARKQGLAVAAFDTGRFKEGILVGSGGGNIALINRAPHPNAAKIFINWLLSREGQIAWQKLVVGGRNSLRSDIPKDDVPLYARIPEGTKYTLIDDPAYSDMESVRKFVNEVWKKKK